MLLLLLAQSPLVLTGPATPGSPSADLRRVGCQGPEAVHRIEYATDSDADGVPEFMDVVVNRYDARGNNIRSDYVSDTSSSRFEATYDANDQVVQTVESYDVDGDGVFDARTVTDTTYDGAGRVLTSRRESVENGNAAAVTLVSYTYNSSGFLTRVLVSTDQQGDGVWDVLLEESRVLDSDGRTLSLTKTTDDPADGTIDALTETTNTYEANGNLILQLFRSDDDNDGVDDFTSSTSLVYDAQDRLLSRVVEVDVDADGTLDGRDTYTYTYDASGNRLSEVWGADRDGDGVPDTVFTRLWTYDGAGNVLVQQDQTDSDANGVPDVRIVVTTTYDAGNRPVLSVTEFFTTSPVPQSISTQTLSYTPAGTLLVDRTESDNDNDGVVDSVFVRRNSVEELRLHVTRYLRDDVAEMSLGGHEVGLTAILDAAVEALQQSSVPRATRSMIAFDVVAGTLESLGLISPADGVALRAEVPSFLALYRDSCFGPAQ